MYFTQVCAKVFTRSESLEFSGWTFLVLISGSVMASFDHHSILLTFSMFSNTDFLSSKIQADSSTLTSPKMSESIIGG